jgi:hypothetical protein
MMKLTQLPPLRGLRRLVVVVGCQRSGTTLLGQVIGAQPGCLLIDEFEGLYRWFDAVASGAPDAAAATEEIIVQAGAKYAEPDTRVDGDARRLAPQIDTLVLKAPNLTFDADRIAGLGVPVSIVYPVRDPRAVVASMQRLAHIDFVERQRGFIAARPTLAARYPAQVAVLEDVAAPRWARAAQVWAIKSDLGDTFEAEGLPVLQFNYEAFVADPAPWSEKVLAFCGLRDAAKAVAHQDVYKGLGPGGTDRQRPVDATSLAQWQRDLDPGTACAILEAAQPVAAKHGYV